MYFAFLFAVVLTSVGAITWYEKAFPLTSDSAEGSKNPNAPAASSLNRVPPDWLDRIMALVYPGSLGVDEGIANGVAIVALGHFKAS